MPHATHAPWQAAGLNLIAHQLALPHIESHDDAVGRHLEAACTRWTGWGEAEVAVGPDAEVCVREQLDDLAEKLEALEHER
jgi:hypothetical protein